MYFADGDQARGRDRGASKNTPINIDTDPTTSQVFEPPTRGSQSAKHKIGFTQITSAPCRVHKTPKAVRTIPAIILIIRGILPVVIFIYIFMIFL
jgi:hypothetical protein